MVPRDFFLSLKVISALMGIWFEIVEAVKTETIEVMMKLSENNFQHLVEQRKSLMEWCKDRGGEHIEGNKSAVEDKNFIALIRFFSSHT